MQELSFMEIGKRVVDILLSLVGMAILVPLIPIIGLLIKLDSRGPVFYLADRVGKGMKPFKMYKFRTMLETPVRVGESVSPQFDPRVTTFGRFLRRTKMNELPQFLNVFKGDMTFVGPRPEAPDLAALYPEEAKRVFSIKPGLVGPATIFGRNEEEVYPPGVDAKKYYIEHILPAKNKIDLEYLENPSFFKDLKYILLGAKETLIGALDKRHIRDNRSQIYLLLSDIFWAACSYMLAYAASLYVWNTEIRFLHPFWTFPLMILIRLACNIYFHLYNSLIRYISYHDILNVLKGVTSGSFLLVLIDSLTGRVNYSGRILVIDWACLIFFLSISRLILRIYWDATHRKNDERQKRRILIYGVCDEGNLACRALTSENYSPFQVIGFIDDEPAKYGKFINGKKVLGTTHHIKTLAKLYQVEEILVANPDIRSDRLQEVMAICLEAGIRCRLFNSLEDFASKDSYWTATREMNAADVLPLARITADHSEVERILRNKTVLINGPSGAFGLELCRKILQHGCQKLIILDRYESYLNEMVAALLNRFPQDSLLPFLIQADQEDNLEEVFRTHQPSVVIHAGMRKYEPFLGVDLGDLGQTNYFRTFHLAKLAANSRCEIFIVITSLLAKQNTHPIVNSLRIAELSLGYFFSDTHTRFIIDRLCDIVENRGGIVSTLETQLQNRKAVVLPYPEAQARLISKDSAAEFILMSLTEAEGSSFSKSIFNCDPGPPIPLMEVTKRISNLYGLKPGPDFEIKYARKSVDEPIISSHKDAPHSEIPPADYDYDLDAISADKVKSLFKDFVLLGNPKISLQDRRARTRELIKLIGPDTLIIQT
jgi:FlaA1/EpsC-like NDP-sugar epimerase/lipopolysaccharide/colanic/teichoic acid biosynthesis glycosyltransferase